jgi:hypothetical protein
MLSEEFNFLKNDTEIDRKSWSAARPLDQLLLLPEEGH